MTAILDSLDVILKLLRISHLSFMLNILLGQMGKSFVCLPSKTFPASICIRFKGLRHKALDKSFIRNEYKYIDK